MRKIIKMERVDDETQLPSPVAQFWKLLDRRIDEAKERSVGAKEFDVLKSRAGAIQASLKELACGTCEHADFQISTSAPSFVSETGEESDSGTEFDSLRVHCAALGGVSCQIDNRNWDENWPATSHFEVLVWCQAKEEAPKAFPAAIDYKAESEKVRRKKEHLLAMETCTDLESRSSP